MDIVALLMLLMCVYVCTAMPVQLINEAVKMYFSNTVYYTDEENARYYNE